MPLIEELPDDYDEPPSGAWQCSVASEFEFYEGTETWDEHELWGEQDWWDYSDVPADAYEYIRAVRLCDVASEPQQFAVQSVSFHRRARCVLNWTEMIVEMSFSVKAVVTVKFER